MRETSVTPVTLTVTLITNQSRTVTTRTNARHAPVTHVTPCGNVRRPLFRGGRAANVTPLHEGRGGAAEPVHASGLA